MTLYKDDETRYYIGSRSSKQQRVCPEEFLTGAYNSSSITVKQMLEEGWQCKREILHTFAGNAEGARQCCRQEGELLREVNAKSNVQYIKIKIIAVPYTTLRKDQT